MVQNGINKELIPLIFSLLFFLVISGCSEKDGQAYLGVISVSNPVELSQELQNVTFYLEKNVNDENIVSIVRLDLKSNEKHILLDEGNDVDLSPDKRVVIYVHGEYVDGEYHHGLWIYELGEKTETKIAGWQKDITDIALTGPSFSADGNKVIFSISWLETDNNGLAVVNVDGSNFNILNTNLPLNMGPKYSPNGNLIVVTCAGVDEVTGEPGFQLCLLDKNGLFRKQLTNRGDMNSSYYFTPDGTKIVYSEVDFGGIFQIIRKRKDRFIVMEIDGENKKEILDWDVGIKGFSKDGDEIIFEGRPDEKSPWGIYIINIDGTNLRHLTYFDEFLEEWYADIEQY